MSGMSVIMFTACEQVCTGETQEILGKSFVCYRYFVKISVFNQTYKTKQLISSGPKKIVSCTVEPRYQEVGYNKTLL